jgi:alpha-beta hydrolase superfamily lysophospholipase
VRFAGGAIDPATLTAANMRVIRLTLDNATKGPLLPPAAGALAPSVLAFGTDYTATVSTEFGSAGGTLIIRPTRPLQASTGSQNIGYLVLLTNGVHSTTGAVANPDNDYQLVRDQAIAELQAGATSPTCTPITNTTLRSICRLTFGHLAIGAQTGINPATVIVSFSYSTESTADTLGALAQITAASPPTALTVVPLPGPLGTLNTKDVNSNLFGIANIYAGTLTIPYYLSAPSAANPAAPVNRFWTAAGPSPAPGIDPASRNLTRFNPVPAKTADLQIPIFVTVPNAFGPTGGVRPTNGWPTVIFQHGLTRNRVDAVAIADAFAQAGFVVVSIDLPLHGIGATSSAAAFRMAGLERTFDLDVSNNATLAPGADGIVDGSGQNFVNLSSLLTTRDNLRQGAVDLLTLTRALPTLELTGDTTPDVDPARIHFVGHSLGSIVGGTYARFGANARTASLLNTGGGVAQTIVDSPAFGPAIKAGLAAQGAIEGTTLYNQFLRDAQTAADAGDPLNYFSALLAAKPVHVTQVVGAPPTWQPDLVVPNSSTQRMITAGGAAIRRVSAAGPNPTAAGNGGYVNFVAGHHGSIIDPSCSNPPVGPTPATCVAVTTEMQRQTVAFAAADGAAIVITDTTVVQP